MSKNERIAIRVSKEHKDKMVEDCKKLEEELGGINVSVSGLLIHCWLKWRNK